MDSVLSEFVARTGADVELARDILDGQQWDLTQSLRSFYCLKGIASSATDVTATMPNSTSYAESPPLRGETGLYMNKYRPSEAPTYTGPPATNQQSALGSPQKPTLQKTEAVEIDDGANKKLTRGISRATDNVNLVSKARNEFALDFKDSAEHHFLLDLAVETPVFTFTLPDLTIYPDDFVAFLEKDLIETSTLVSLEQAGRLNWWTEYGACQRLWPLATTGDGNCLLHAGSLGMWGFHDRLLTLRKALNATLTRGPHRSALWRRWRWQQTLQNKEAGLMYSESEWQKEWDNLLRLSSTEPRLRPGRKTGVCEGPSSRGPTTRGIGVLEPVSETDEDHDIYESLEEIHVLALAHVLRRPIIVVADTMLKDVKGEPFAPIPFGGIYLPLECRAVQCHRSPLVLTYDAAHFSALVAMEREAYADKSPQPAAVIPLTDADHQLLPLQYAVDPGEDFRWGLDDQNPRVVQQLTLSEDDKLTLLVQFLDIDHVPITGLGGAVSDDHPHHQRRPTDVSAANGLTETDKKSSGSSFESDDSSPSSTEASGGGGVGGTGGLFVTNHRGGGSKAARQFQSVARQFGSIGRSMSKKLKKNFGNFKLVRSNSYKETGSSNSSSSSNSNGASGSYSKKSSRDAPDGCGQHLALTLPATHSSVASSRTTPKPFLPNHILAARLHTDKRHEYQEEMVKNYLHSARARFEREKRNLKPTGAIINGATTTTQYTNHNGRSPEPTRSSSSSSSHAALAKCVNPWCPLYGTAASHYLCSSCYEKQKEQERASAAITKSDDSCDVVALTTDTTDGATNNTLYGIGRSRFYKEPDLEARAALDGGRQMQVTRKPTLNPNQTLYLSNSTFYNDINTPPGSNLCEPLTQLVLAKSSDETEHVVNEKLVTTYAFGQPTTITNGNHTSALPNSYLVAATAGLRALPKMCCQTPKCPFFGTSETGYYCSQCHKEQNLPCLPPLAPVRSADPNYYC